MKKIALALVMASGLMAAGSDYVGISAGSADLETRMPGGDFTVDANQYTLTLGHYYGETGRVSASYTYMEHGSSIDNRDMFSFAYDFILPLANNNVGLYAGPVVGYTRYSDATTDLSGMHYGAQAGVIVRLVDSFELEGGYRYLFETGSEGDVDLDNITMWYGGFNYRF